MKTTIITAPMQSMMVDLLVKENDSVRQNQELAILEAMKMQHAVVAPYAGKIVAIHAAQDAMLEEGQKIFSLEETEEAVRAPEVETPVPATPATRADFAEFQTRHHKTLDAARPEAVAKRRSQNRRTARENIADLCDADSFLEYGAFVVAAQRRRRKMDDLIANTPADGLIAGFGSINADLYGEARSQAAVLAYDYTVLAGTQGIFNHKKTDRVLELAARYHRPIVFFTEGGGGRPGDIDVGDISVAGLDVRTFATYASARSAPRIAINAGRCYAGNAVIFGTSDVRIATKASWIGMGGPAMIEGGGLGQYRPEDIGPIEVQAPNGVVDLVAEDEPHAIQQAKELLGFFQGRRQEWNCAEQKKLRDLIPEDRQRVYDIRSVIFALADQDSVLELRKDFGKGMIVGFVRVEGRALGLIANNPMHLGGAIDAEAAEKAAWFLRLCDLFHLPLLSLCDTPGFMVGPESEKEAAVRHASDMMLAGASLSKPAFMICLRKGYGLGAQAMAVGSFHAPFFSIAWPTGEFGGMGLEGAVRLGYKKELAAAPTEEAKQALYEKLVAKSYERGKALSMASVLEIDTVIDPKDSRAWIVKGLKATTSSLTR